MAHGGPTPYVERMRARSIPLSLASVLIAAGCGGGEEAGEGGGNPAALASFSPGSRLTPRVLDGGGGAELFIELYDEELQIACSFLPVGEGEYRCVPTSEDAWYVDAACQEPALQVGCEGALPASLFGSEACDDGTPLAVFLPLGDAPFASEWILGSGATCHPQGAQREIVRAERVPLARFVRGVVEDVPVGGDASIRRIVADDGATVAIELLRAGQVCEPVVFGGEPRCLDVATIRMDDERPLFADQSCQGERAVYLTPSSCGAEPAVLVAKEGTECSEGTLYAVGEGLDRAWEGGLDGCWEVETDAPVARVGAALVADELPALTPVERGTARIRIREMALGGVTVAAADRAELHDVQLDTPCAPKLTNTGEMRCIPTGFGLARRMYSDAACTQPLFGADVDHCGQSVQNRFAAVTDALSCAWTMGRQAYDGVVSEVWERGATFEGTAYELGENGTCSAVEDSSPLYAVGSVHPVEDFALLQRRP